MDLSENPLLFITNKFIIVMREAQRMQIISSVFLLYSNPGNNNYEGEIIIS